jgi:hypothetical protein
MILAIAFLSLTSTLAVEINVAGAQGRASSSRTHWGITSCFMIFRLVTFMTAQTLLMQNEAPRGVLVSWDHPITARLLASRKTPTLSIALSPMGVIASTRKD